MTFICYELPQSLKKICPNDMNRNAHAHYQTAYNFFETAQKKEKKITNIFFISKETMNMWFIIFSFKFQVCSRKLKKIKKKFQIYVLAVNFGSQKAYT